MPFHVGSLRVVGPRLFAALASIYAQRTAVMEVQHFVHEARLATTLPAFYRLGWFMGFALVEGHRSGSVRRERRSVSLSPIMATRRAMMDTTHGLAERFLRFGHDPAVQEKIEAEAVLDHRGRRPNAAFWLTFSVPRFK